MMIDAHEALRRLADLWTRERACARASFAAARAQTPLADRVKRGVALTQLSVVELEAASADRTRHWLEGASADALGALRLRAGDPVLLWRQSPEEPGAVRAVIDRVTRHRIAVLIDGEPPEALESPGFKLDADDPQVTFARGARAIAQWRGVRAQDARDPRAKLLAALLGSGTATGPHAARAPDRERDDALERVMRELTWLDVGLHPEQRRAVALSQLGHPVTLVHGPPGTGKTRTLVEIVAQAAKQQRRVLATAASNMATDHLASQLARAGLKVVRLGHPARVHDEALALTLDAQLEAHDVYKLTRAWLREANELFRRLRAAQDRQSMSYEQRRELRREANGLMRDVRLQTRAAQRALLERAQVICATATGADMALLDELEVDLVVLDEATQAPDPLALIPMWRAPRVVLAGDPHQLAPTILDAQVEREGLGSTFFARLLERAQTPHVMLTVQHRMHEAIMAFPSQSKYQGALVAHPSVATHHLGQLGVGHDPLRDHALILIDTAGKGWEEAREDEDPSTFNPEQAERAALEVERLMSRGLPAAHIALITPYEAQARRLRRRLGAALEAGLEIATIDSFQGREREAVVLDLVRSNDRQELGFLLDTRRMNVALTRAKRLLLILADSATLGDHPYYEALLRAVERHGLWLSAWSDEAEPLDPA